MDRILIIGAGGQLGTELTQTLRAKYSNDQVIATDIHALKNQNGPFEIIDALDQKQLLDVVDKYGITQIYHLAAVLSAKGELNPKKAWDVNMNSLLNILDLGKTQIKKIFWPSSIAVFGPDAPKTNTPQFTNLNPTTVYGISKLAGEQWCEYYHDKYGVDVRSLRYPGLIGYKAPPGGGTTDYAVEIFWKAHHHEKFECFLKEDTRLPMMYMNDAVRATIELMEADFNKVKVRTSYNLAGISFTPFELYQEILKFFPDFHIDYHPDERQQIASSWPESIDDSLARNDWGWTHEYDLVKMTNDFIAHMETEHVGE